MEPYDSSIGVGDVSARILMKLEVTWIVEGKES